MNNYIDVGGIENVACALIKYAKKDFIKGAKILYSHMKSIPTQKELMLDSKHRTLSNNQSVRWMYDSWRFVRNDPYSFFGDVGEESVINSWKREAIIEYYRTLYITGAIILYQSKGKKEIYNIANSSVKKKIEDPVTANDFIVARDYILNLVDGKGILDQWNVIAYERFKRLNPKNPKKIKSGANSKRAEQRAKNVLKAKELSNSGISTKAIAEYLGVTSSCVAMYLRS